MEFHPRVDLFGLPLVESKIILGSFPTWALTISDEGDTDEKEMTKSLNNDFDFFYGSSANRFWNWYKDHIDSSIITNESVSIIASLKKHRIGITDMIVSCRRKNRSALDKHLTGRTYNFSFLREPSKGEKIRILCTSKGVMNEMLLSKSFYKKNINLKLDPKSSMEVQCEIITKIDGDIKLVNKPFYQVLHLPHGGQIECLAVPSPGSPFRKLNEFGKAKGDNIEYLNKFLHEAFSWFNSTIN